MSRPRRKLPPYGKALVQMRNAGTHPERVVVIIGSDWGRRPDSEPSICVPEQGFEDMDFSILAGLKVLVVWRSGEGLDLAKLVAEHAAPVEIAWPAEEDDWPFSPGSAVRWDIERLVQLPSTELNNYRARKLARWQLLADQVLAQAAA